MNEQPPGDPHGQQNPDHYQGQQQYYPDRASYQGQRYGQQRRLSEGEQNELTSISARLGRRRAVDGFSCGMVGAQP